jgi:hypothetical protein
MPQAEHPLRLDRSRYHSSIHGDFNSNVRFYQDGLPFDAHGHLCVEHCSAEQLAKADAKAPARRMPDVDGQMSEGSDPTSDIRPPTSDVNLELWAKGEARYPPFKVFAAIRERYSKSVSTFADAIKFLVSDVKLIPASEASKKLLAGGSVAPAIPPREEEA